MNIMDAVQILILLLLVLLILKPFLTCWLPAKWHSIFHRVMPPRALKYEGTWQKKSLKKDDDKS